MPVGLREYARHRKASGLAGGTLTAVQGAIKSGRLSRSLTPDRKQIANVAAADAEWSATTHADRRPLTGPTAATPAPKPTADSSAARTGPADTPIAAAGAIGAPPPDLMESRARREAAEAALAEIELAKERAELIQAKDVERRLVDVFTNCKTKLLGIPSGALQLDPTFTAAQLEVIESLIRESLEELAGAAAE